MAWLSRNLHLIFRKFSNSVPKRSSRKFTLWLSGLALAFGGLTLAQAGHSNATPAANSVPGTTVNVSTTNSGAKSSIKPHTNVKIEANQFLSSSSNDQPPATSTSVTVNGHSIPVPKKRHCQYHYT